MGDTLIVVIYALVDECGVPRYVGQTQKRLSSRLSQHQSVARSGRRPLDVWLRSCPAASIVPLEVAPPDPDEAERRWIVQMRAGGVKLLNLAAGGRRGPTGLTHTPEVRARIATARRGKPLSQEHREKLSASHSGVSLGPEHRAAIGRGGKGRVFSPTHRERLRAGKVGDLNPMSARRRAEREGGDGR